ncbi:MAG: SpoIIE family protein phosphatase [Oscillospiraceae bacterium]|nr:SpoIIE family protein phosphatase [Oscillospiraceae bacterium]
MTKAHKLPIKAGILLFMCTALALLLLTQRAGAESNNAVDPLGHSDNYSAVLYNNTNGLPTSEANDIAQTSEGFIWIGSYSGLIRYDGSTFERMDSTSGIASVVALLADSRDRLWIGTNDNGVALMERGELHMWGLDDGLGASKICTLEEGEGGVIYVGTTSGIAMIYPDLSLVPLDDPKIADAYMEHIVRGSDGLLYCTTNEDDLFTIRNGELVDYSSHSDTRIKGITCILPDSSAPGKLYIGTEGSDFYYGDPKGDFAEMEQVDISPLFTVIDARQIGDQVWICANNGIGVLDSEGFHNMSELPMYNSVNTVMADYEGNLWFTSSRQGVMKLAWNRFSDIFARFNVSERVVNSTCMHDGQLFIATDTGLMVLDNNGPVSSVPLTSAVTASGEKLDESDLIEMLDGTRIRSVIRDSRDRLWISTWRGCGLLCCDGGSVTAFNEADGLLSDRIRAVCEAADGSILVAHTGGVCVIKDGRVTAACGKDDGISNLEILTVASAPNGDILLGSNGDGIYVINEEGTRCIGLKDGLSSAIVMRIIKDPTRDVFWIVTSNSIAYMSSDYSVTTIKKFPYSNNFDMYENSQGDMWILSSNGIYVTPSEELLANGEINPVHYGMANGLPCISTSNSYSELTAEGDLYISGNTGVAKVNIETPLEDVSDIKQSVPYIEADGQLLYPGKSGGFSVPAGTQKLTVYPYVYNYSLTDPRVSYRLVGFDRDFVTVSRSELGPVTYTNLSGGAYSFMMELQDALGRESKTLSVPIVKEKALHEQPWFYGLIALAAALLLAAGMQLYILRKMQALEKKQREQAERERIGNELDMATRIQRSMLPHEFPPFPDRREFDVYASMDPAREVGGDFYDFFMIDEGHLCLVIADVSGKGIPAALFMMVSKAILQSCAMLGQSAAEILTKTNEGLCSGNQTDMFVIVWLGILEISTGKITAANAGHEYPVLAQNGSFSLFRDRHGFVIGGMDGMKYREYEIQLKPGDRLFLYTDGVPEATDADNRMFGVERMLEVLNGDMEASPRELLGNVRKAVDDFVNGAEQFDDLTMLCIEYNGPGGDETEHK